jgi:hypothetical protein
MDRGMAVSSAGVAEVTAAVTVTGADRGTVTAALSARPDLVSDMHRECQCHVSGRCRVTSDDSRYSRDGVGTCAEVSWCDADTR